MFADYHNPNEYWQHNPIMTDPNIDPDDAMKSGCFVLIFYILAFIVGVALCVLFGSCTKTEYVTVEKVRVDTMYQNHIRHDSVYIHDSAFIKEKGDSVLIERWHTIYRETKSRDTIYRATHDTIPQPYPIETVKLVEKELNWWQRLRLWIGNIGLLGILGVIGFYGVKLWRVYKIF